MLSKCPRGFYSYDKDVVLGIKSEFLVKPGNTLATSKAMGYSALAQCGPPVGDVTSEPKVSIFPVEGHGANKV